MPPALVCPLWHFKQIELNTTAACWGVVSSARPTEPPDISKQSSKSPQQSLVRLILIASLPLLQNTGIIRYLCRFFLPCCDLKVSMNPNRLSRKYPITLLVCSMNCH